MLKEIIEAFCGEIQELFVNDNDVTVLRDTQFEQNQTPSHTLPLVILGLGDSPDMVQLSGGCTQAEWNWVIRAYFIDSNAELSPDQSFSTGSYEIIEKIVNHINFQSWLTQAFIDVVQIHNFRLTFVDVTKAAPIMKEDGGMIPGYQVVFSSIALDTRTAYTVYSDLTLAKAVQVPFTDAALATDVTEINVQAAFGSQGVFNIIASTPWVITSIPPWAAVTSYEGEANAEIEVTVEANTRQTTRTGNITIKAPLSGALDVVVAVVQDAI